MATLKAKVNVVYERDNFGRFISECEAAANRTVERTVKLGADTAKAMAPVGGERKADYSRRPGYIPLKKSIRTRVSGTRGEWYSIAPHWSFVEFPTSAHEITGKLHFPWKHGLFVWNDPRYHNWDESGATVHHPGTGAQPFLRPSYELAAKRQMMQIAKQEFPG